ncbi:hypothetical protein [Clostridium niameyense]|nr:hypothetical protein [Clostridium niameyense]
MQIFNWISRRVVGEITKGKNAQRIIHYLVGGIKKNRRYCRKYKPWIW